MSKQESSAGDQPGPVNDSTKAFETGAPEDLPAKSIPDAANHPFTVVGIGASAGGLEALELFLKNIPPGSGMAFIIIQHLDPDHKGMLVELLQRVTHLPVVQVRDLLPIKPDRVYVIPPNKNMSILREVLYLFPPVAPRGLRLPIDFFFRSLADDQQEHSVGVILSGMGSDGTLGLRAIKEKAGAAFVQTPETAQFDSMPRSAIDAGLADVVAPAEELPGKIGAYNRRIPFLVGPDIPLETKTQSNMDKVLILLRAHTKHDFSQYKKSTVYRRVERRMGLHQIDRISNYVRLLQENPQETELLFKELLIGVTSFFRDIPAWEYLKHTALPELLANHPQGGRLRAWTPGCSTGEEAYSLAMVFKEALDQAKTGKTYALQIFATDLDRDAIEKARQGFYPANIVADVPPERLQRFLVQEDRGYRVSKEIREMVVFAPQNLVMDAPFTKLDLLVCRNLLIYFEAELQRKLLPLFHYSLNPGGLLFLGSSESVGGFTNLFHTLEVKHRIYNKIEASPKPELVDFPSTFFPDVSAESNRPNVPARSIPSQSLPALLDQFILRDYAPAAVLTNANGDILCISGRTGKYLEPAAGKANLNIFAMAREGLRFELNSAYQKVIREKTTTTLRNLSVGTNGGTQTIDLTVQFLMEPAGLRGLILAVFQNVAAPHPKQIKGKNRNASILDDRANQLQEELLGVREELQNTHDEMQTSQEELKSINEEFQSTNEELQSTNEELTTSKEEMQSLNEELQTVNHEMQARMDELSSSNNDMKNLLDSTNIATLFLDETLHVRRFTNQASKIINLIPGDAGRPITDIASDLIYPELGQEIRQVLKSLVFKEKPVATQDGKWFSVRIMPYRTMDNRIDGVVITYTDISASKTLETVLRDSEQAAQALFNRMPSPFGLFETILDDAGGFKDCRFVSINAAFERTLGITSHEVHGALLSAVWPGARSSGLNMLREVAFGGVPASFEVQHAPTGKTFHCVVYRPGEAQSRLCMILDEMK